MAIDPRQPQPNRVEGLQSLQDVLRSRSLRDDAQMVQGMPPKTQPMMPQQQPMMPQQQPMMPQQESSLNSLLKEDLPIHVADLKERGTSKEAKAEMDAYEKRISLQDINRAASGLDMRAAPALDYANYNPEKAAASGGLMGMALGDMPTQQAARGGGVDNFAGQVPGQGHGMQDNVYMPIIEKQAGQQVATLAVSPDEYVLDAHTMSALGNGSADEGARYMDNMVKNIRTKAYGTEKQPNEINGLAALRPMIERV
jgi:hypothetical protein|tara:strand:- start:3085 stop:3849 length:765 start_codon:yes stop_codon:yes gene_type:complete